MALRSQGFAWLLEDLNPLETHCLLLYIIMSMPWLYRNFLYEQTCSSVGVSVELGGSAIVHTNLPRQGSGLFGCQFLEYQHKPTFSPLFGTLLNRWNSL